MLIIGRLFYCAGALFLLANFVQTALASEDTAASRAEHSFFTELARYNKNSNDPEIAWHFARACFDWADYASSNARRAAIAEQGIAAARQAIGRAPRLAAPHYYLALNLGQLARTKKLAALKLVEEMETELKTAIALDPKFDYAGPHRSLGLLYADAPGWPTSIGNHSKARLHLHTAIELSPEYPDNQLSLLELELKWGEKAAVQSELPATEKLLQRARMTFTGETWLSSWEDWDRRWQALKAKLGQPSSRLESPRQKK
jgi:hypothetical protein